MREDRNLIAEAAPEPGRARIRVGSAPDSWGVWFPDDPEQVPWQRFLDEVSACGFEWIELGPYGYLPTDPAQLSDELAARGLQVSAGTVFEHLHRPDSWDAVWGQVRERPGTGLSGGHASSSLPAEIRLRLDSRLVWSGAAAFCTVISSLFRKGSADQDGVVPCSDGAR